MRPVPRNGFNRGEGGYQGKNVGKKVFNKFEDEEYKIGKLITIHIGPLKGYKGRIKNIDKDRI
jgi:transcription antitermination factor NusG